jgi:MscS family membrane protein
VACLLCDNINQSLFKETGTVCLNYKKNFIPSYLVITAILSLILFLWATETAIAKTEQEPSKSEAAETDSIVKKKMPSPGPLDEFNRGTPRTAVEGFIDAARNGKFQMAAEYLDLRAFSSHKQHSRGPQLARQLKIVLDRSLVIEPESLSTDPKGNMEDGLKPSREALGQIKTPVKTVDILLHRIPREDGVRIWKFSRQTVAEIPHLNNYFGYRPFEKKLSRLFPDVVFLGWQLWQYAVFFVGIGLAYLLAYFLSLIVRWFVKRSSEEMGRQMEALGIGPTRILLWFLLVDRLLVFIGPSVTIRALLSQNMLGIIAAAWAASRLVQLCYLWWVNRLQKRGQASAIPLLKPTKTFLNIVIVSMAVLVWLDNIGFNVGTLLAGLGVGGIAFALAAQDTIKNLLGSIMILLDKPYRVGQRIVVKGHDGVVEEIGLRSTKLRLLSGHQTTVPNELMAKTDIENITRRPHIKRSFNLALRYDTPLEKIDRAIKIIEDILEDHEGMNPDLPPRVYFNEFNRDSLNIFVFFWYHPPDRWAFMALNQRINKQIMCEFERDGIKFALPSTSVNLTQS